LYRPTDLASMAGIALVYLALAKAAVAYAAIDSVAILWPSSGLALAALLHCGLKCWPGVFAGALAAELMAGFPPWGAGLNALGNTLEPVVGVWLLSRAGFDKTIPTLKDYLLLLVFAGVVGTAVSATLGSAVTVLAGVVAPGALPASFFRWWMGNMLGALLAVPLLVWRAGGGWWPRPQRVSEAALLSLVTLLFGAAVFHGYWREAVGPLVKAYWAFPLIVWAAARFGVRGTSAILLLVQAVSLWGVARGTGYFGQDMAQTGLFNFWLYHTIVNLTGMALATTFNENRTATAILEHERRRLRDSERRLREYLEFSPVPLGVAEAATRRIVFLNRAFVHLFGYTLEDLPTLDAWAEKAYPGSARQALAHGWFAPPPAGRAPAMPAAETKIVCKDGRERLVEAVAAPPGEHLLAAFNDITQKRQAKELIWRQAHYDALTELPNRRLFLSRLREDIRRSQAAGRGLALLLLDLDHFKEVNDSFGHDVGDLLLVNVARRLAACVSEGDTVARLGGDEFTVLLPMLDSPERVGQVAQAILDALAIPFRLGHEQVFISASIGITRCPEDSAEVKSLLKSADQALFETKSLGRNRFSYFTRALHEAAQARLSIIRDLRGALATGQLVVHYQPIVDLRSGRVTKAEALLRWLHPVRGTISPASFIAVAEDIGLISEIGDWVFKQAARQAKRCLERCCAGVQISVNKSARQFLTGQGHEAWIGYLDSIGLPGECIAIEITENVLLDDRPELIGKLRQFRLAGIQVSIDDFGTGYSSLSYLKKFDIDYLKIDRAFVRDLTSDPSDLALSEAIIVMAHKLGLKVVAEGVETALQRDLLAASGCDYAQGFFYAQALPSDAFEAFVADWNGRLP
jgi:diguanylate cyclase (GGDEF)-like protein/PAS domain S-box-containing protein